MSDYLEDPDHKVVIRFEIDPGEGYTPLHGSYIIQKGMYPETIREDAMRHFRSFLLQCIPSKVRAGKPR